MKTSKEKASHLNIIVTAIKIYGLEKVERIIQNGKHPKGESEKEVKENG